MVDGGNHASCSAIVGVDASPGVVHATRGKGVRRSWQALEGLALVLRLAPRQSASAVVLGKFTSVEGIARVALRQTGEEAAGLGLVLVAER